MFNACLLNLNNKGTYTYILDIKIYMKSSLRIFLHIRTLISISNVLTSTILQAPHGGYPVITGCTDYCLGQPFALQFFSGRKYHMPE